MNTASDPSVIGAFADDLFLHGHHLIRWITDYVDIEESLAAGSISQEEMAHAATLLELEGVGSRDRNWRIFVRPAEQWCPSRLTATADDDWGAAVARGFFFTFAVAVMLDHLRVAKPAARDRIDVMAAEQDLHRVHWERWVRILARDLGTAEAFRAALAQQADSAADLFGVPDERIGGSPGAEELHERWMASVTSSLDAVGVPAIGLPLHTSPRSYGTEDGPVGETLRALRAVRLDHPERVYPVH